MAGTALAQPQKYSISTAAGNGVAGFGGDGGQAVGAQLNFPVGVVVDSSGSLYISDTFNQRIRKVTADGTISTFAGTGTAGSAGDGSSATAATVADPTGLAIDKSGNIYFSDTANHTVRKITSGGTISKVAGKDAIGYSGDGGAATDSALDTPIGLALDDAGNLYIADAFNQRIRKVGTDGKISTIAGNGAVGFAGDGGAATSAAFRNPQGLAMDAGGNLYVADTHNHRIRKIAKDGTITTVAGNGVSTYGGDAGPAVKASLNYPKGIAVDAKGNLYIADCFNSRIRVVSGDTIFTIAGDGTLGSGGDGGTAGGGQLFFPSSVAFDAAGNLFVADNDNSRIRRLSPVIDPGQLPAISKGGVISAAAFGAFSSVAPGSWIEIYGSALSAESRIWSGGDFQGGKAPTSLAGTTVTIGGRAATLAYVSPGQINAQVPADLGPGERELRVTTAAGSSAPYAIAVNAVQPGLFAPAAFRAGGKQYLGAILPDGETYVLPPGAVQGAASRPARAGETVTVYGAGFGQADLPFQILFGDTAARVSYAGLAPGAIGLYQFNVVVPNVPSGDAVPVSFTLGGVSGEQSLHTAVQN